jgi:Zn finger protein HypA/HybF involved in hydrogenase expression
MRLRTVATVATLALLLAFPRVVAFAQGTENPHGPNVGACATCHSPNAWKPARISAAFKHAERSFPLEGAHTRTACLACHKSLEFSKAPRTCGSCHSDVHKGELGVQCARCHTSRSFVDQGQLRRMHELTQLPLRGAHAALSCDACHTPTASGQAQYVGRPAVCYACHSTQYRQAKAPDHFVAQFSTDCASCHGSATWQNAQFDHSLTHFALTGAHRAVSCAGCHADNVYRGKTTACAGCHQATYAATTTPPHVSSGFSTSCESCHTTVAWAGASFNHANTRFPLTGGHLAVACSACHSDGVYAAKSTACVSCHQSNYSLTTTPPHAASAFPLTCEACHSTASWLTATFNHANTRFPLTGLHLTTPCAACHGDGVYAAKTTLCSGCHMTDYNGTNNPAHAAAGFPATCDQCHTTTTWLGATFNHDASFFLIYSGSHKGKWSLCTDCHSTSSNYAQFTCFQCHLQATTASGHKSVSGYKYDSPSCYACHPRGNTP